MGPFDAAGGGEAAQVAPPVPRYESVQPPPAPVATNLEGALGHPAAQEPVNHGHKLLHALVNGAHTLGSYAAGALNAASDPEHFQAQQDQLKQIQQQHDEQYRKLIFDAIGDPNSTPEQRNAAGMLLKHWNDPNVKANNHLEAIVNFIASFAPRSHDIQLQMLKNQGAAGHTSTARPVPFERGSISVKDARGMADAGMVYNDENGHPIDLSKLPEDMKITPWGVGGKIVYVAGDQVPRVITADNQRTVQPEEGALSPAGQAPSLGAARVGSVHTATSPGGGQVVTGTTSPVTPSKTSSSGTVGPMQQKHKGMVDESRVTTEGILPNIQSMTPQNATAARKAQPAVTAELGLFGDPQNPSVKSMADFAELADDPHAQLVLGKAFKLLDQEMGEISQPGIIATLGSAAGWAGFKAGVEAGVQREAGTDMTQQEKEYFDTAIASMADIIGSRAATGQSPARFSVKSIQNELPLIGSSSVTDKTSYLTKMGTIARQIEVGLNGMPDNGRALAWMRKRQKELQENRSSKQSGGKVYKIGDPIMQEGHKFKVTAVDKNGKVIDAEAVP